MKKELKFYAIFVISILFLSLIISAAGTGEGGSNPSNQENDSKSPNTTANNSDSDLTTDNKMKGANKTINKTRTIKKLADLRDYNCEDFNEMNERVKCRLINRDLAERYNKNNNVIPEACRLAENKGRCIALYRTTQTCYKLEGKAEDACLKRAIGLHKAHFNETENYTERGQHAREYIVALLYNLEKKVEKQVEEGKINEEQATQLVDKIIEIKALILNNGTKKEVKVKIDELKNMWRNVIKNE